MRRWSVFLKMDYRTLFYFSIDHFSLETEYHIRCTLKKSQVFFQLIPHLQCCKPINCCFIFLLQRGHILLVVPIRIPPGKPVLVFAFCLCGMQFFKYLKSRPFSTFKRIDFFHYNFRNFYWRNRFRVYGKSLVPC